MIWIAIFFLCIIELYAWSKYRDLICPAVIHNILWIVSLIGVVVFRLDSEVKQLPLVVICVGSIIFQIGFTFSLRVSIGKRKDIKRWKYEANRQMIKGLIVVVVLASLPSIYQYYRYLSGSNIGIYQMLTTVDENLALPSFFAYYRKIVEYLSLAFLTIYWKMDCKKRRNVRKYVFVLFIIAIAFVATVPTRNGILSYLLPLVILYIATHPIRNRRIILYGFISIVGFMGLYYVISLGKYWYLYNSASSALNVLGDEIKVYLSGSIIAFGETLKSHAYMYGGKNTFRFFMALGDAVFGTSTAVKLTNEFVYLQGFTTNVYTFYDFYLRDFGLGYALIAQFIVACIHGGTYKGVCHENAFQTYMFSLLSYPLVMQFFQDQYIALLSTWIQVVIVGWIILGTNLFIVKSRIEE